MVSVPRAGAFDLVTGFLARAGGCASLLFLLASTLAGQTPFIVHGQRGFVHWERYPHPTENVFVLSTPRVEDFGHILCIGSIKMTATVFEDSPPRIQFVKRTYALELFEQRNGIPHRLIKFGPGLVLEMKVDVLPPTDDAVCMAQR